MSGAVIEVPGHTAGHIALSFDEERIAFVGDTLFAMGCGRLFEGTAEQMYANRSQRLAALPPETRGSIARTNIRSRTRASPLTRSRTMQRSTDRLAEVEAAARRGEDDRADDGRAGT